MTRCILIGLDGAEPALVERWMDAGLLPNLARLRAVGTYQPCASTRPPVTFPAWTTCVTGVNPGKHGIFDFTRTVPGQQQIQFINSTFRRVPALWNILSDAGKRVAILGVPGTYPPEPINGIMVAGFDSPVATAVDASFVEPREDFDAVKDWRFADFQESNIGPGWHDEALKRLLAKIEDKERIALEQLNREDWDFFMLVFGESDTVSHHFWLFHDPDSPRHRPGHETAIQQVYQRLDETVGKLVEAAGENAVIGIVSDHGFGGAGTGVVHLNNWLAENEYLKFSGEGGSLLKKLALRFVPERWRGTLFRLFKGVATRAESASRFSGIDWGQTRAWSEELNYFPSIRVNLDGRDLFGHVAELEYDAFVQELCEKLEAWDAVAHAWPRAAIFDGPEIEHAPDIIIELALEDGYSHSCLRSRGGPAFRRIEEQELLGGKEKGMNGNHRDPGVFFLSQPFKAAAVSLQDIAPTVLDILDVPHPPMDGRSLLGETRSTVTTETREAPQPYAAEQEAAIEARLRDLGYFE